MLQASTAHADFKHACTCVPFLPRGIQRRTLLARTRRKGTQVHACLKSACAVLAWSILVVLVAAGMKGSVSPAQANIRTASSTTQVTLASTLSVAAAPKTVARPVSRYAVRPGDTLSGHRRAVRRAGRLAGAVCGQPAAHRFRSECHPPRHHPGAAWPDGSGPLHGRGRVTPWRASPRGWPCGAAGRPCTRPTVSSSARIRA